MSSLSVNSYPPYPVGKKVGFIGLGNMGSALATNLALALPRLETQRAPLVIWNRTASKAEAVRDAVLAQGGQVEIAPSVAAMVKECHIIFTSLTDDGVVLAMFDQLCAADDELRAASGPGSASQHPGEGLHTIYVDLSTVSPATTGAIELQVSSKPRRHFVAAPPLGPPAAARSKEVLFATAGAARSKQAIRELIVPGMGSKVIDLGGNHESASTFKLTTNSFLLGLIELLSETMTLGDKTEVGAAKFVEFLQAIMSPSSEVLKYAQKILASDFTRHDGDGFSLEGGINDAGRIAQLAMSVDCPLTVVDAANAHLIAARANAPNPAHLDWSALVAGQRLMAGLDPWKGKRPGLRRD